MMENLRDRIPTPKSKLIFVSLILLVIGILELTLKIFRCDLGEFYSIFWLHLIFVIFLFYWPAYLSKRFSPTKIGLLSPQFRLFLNSLFKAAYYLLAIAVIQVIVLAIFGNSVNDSNVVLPLLLFWPIYVFYQVKPNLKLAILPFGLSIATILAIHFTNPANPKLETFNNYLKDFEAVASMVKTGAIKPEINQSQVELPCKYRHLVGCPNRKISIQKDGKVTTIVFCHDFRLWGAGRSDFVYRSDGKDLAVKHSNYSYIEVRKLAEGWFWRMEKF